MSYYDSSVQTLLSNNSYPMSSPNILISSNWKWPDIPGREDFEGKMLHSASYDRSFDHKGKNVAVIGSGSSSIQVVATR